MYAKIGPKLSQYWPNLRPFQSRTDRRPYLAQNRANMRPRTGPILATPVPGWSWARNRPEMWPVSGTKMVPDLPYFNPQYWYISCSDLETKSHLDRNTLMDVTCPNSWKTHIFLSLGQHPVDRTPPHTNNRVSPIFVYQYLLQYTKICQIHHILICEIHILMTSEIPNNFVNRGRYTQRS